MPSPETPAPTHAEVRAYINQRGGYATFALRRGINQRTAERVFSGKAPPPRWLIREIQAASRETPSREERQALSAFGEGQATARRGGYLSDNPHRYESDQWATWREGFEYQRRHSNG